MVYVHKISFSENIFFDLLLTWFRIWCFYDILWSPLISPWFPLDILLACLSHCSLAHGLLFIKITLFHTVPSYRKYPEGWSTDPGRDSQLEYRLSIYHAAKDDSGTFTCVTPARHTHAVEIVVKRMLLYKIMFYICCYFAWCPFSCLLSSRSSKKRFDSEHAKYKNEHTFVVFLR